MDEKNTDREIQLDDRIREEILSICRQYNCREVLLFGSRARGTAAKTSDIDLAVSGASDFDRLSADMIYNEFTLLPIDVVNLDESISRELEQDILKEGIRLM